jgi:phage anti-repressor protein
LNDLIKTTPENKVDGRSLHEFLQVGTPYTIWFPRMVEYGFVEGTDFLTKMLESTGGRPGINHEMTISMAKEICMLQRTERGKQARLYFIECEEKLKSEAVKAIIAIQEAKNDVQRDKASAALTNARAKQAKLLLEIADRAQVEMYRNIIIAKATNLLADENLLPMPKSEQQRSRHGLAYFCRMVGKPATWASQMGKELLKAGIEKEPRVNGEYIETTAKGGGKQVQGFEWFDDYLTPIVMRMFTHAPESEI